MCVYVKTNNPQVSVKFFLENIVHETRTISERFAFLFHALISTSYGVTASWKKSFEKMAFKFSENLELYPKFFLRNKKLNRLYILAIKLLAMGIQSE